jgi:hypothetical protein
MLSLNLSRIGAVIFGGPIVARISLDVAALGVSLCAATLTGLQWHQASKQRRLQFDTVNGIEVDTDRSGRRLGISIRNVGPGVAFIHSAAFYVDRKLIGNLADAIDEAKLDSNVSENPTPAAPHPK